MEGMEVLLDHFAYAIQSPALFPFPFFLHMQKGPEELIAYMKNGPAKQIAHRIRIQNPYTEDD